MREPLFAFLGLVVLYVLITLYVFSRLRKISIKGDASRLAIASHVVASGLIIIFTIIFLLQL